MTTDASNGEPLSEGVRCDEPCPECGADETYTAFVRQLIDDPSRPELNDPPIGPGYACPDCGAAWRI